MTLGHFARVAALALTLACSIARPAWAEGNAKHRHAKVLFDEGRALAESGRYDQACQKFEQSFGLDAGFGTEFNLADCWTHVGETSRARALFLDVADRTHAAGQKDREQLARERAAALEQPQSEPAEPEAVPTVVIGEAEPSKAKPEATCTEAMSVALRQEYDSLAEATASLHDLQQSVARLSRAAPREPRLRKLRAELSALEKQLASAWAKAGGVATQLARREQAAPLNVPSASDAKAAVVPARESVASESVASTPAPPADSRSRRIVKDDARRVASP